MSINLLSFSGLNIFEQLRIEEALLRADDQNWCLINQGTPDAIVMGISGKPEKLINFSLIEKKPLPIIKRFSGGGTVVTDSNTLFVTFILNQKNIDVPFFPQPLLQWTERLYAPIFGAAFSLKENDYVYEEKKFGGNAQYIQKGRFLHHTSFLWDFEKQKMDYLLLPDKRPRYRNDRSHEDFLCRMKDFFSSKESFIEKLKYQLSSLFSVYNCDCNNLAEIVKRPHRSSTILLH